MTTTAVDITDVKRLQATFTNLAGAATDPTAITLTIREPDGTELAKTKGDMTTTGTGVWYYDHTWPASPGRHIVRWLATGAVATAERQEFWVRQKGTS